MLKPSELKSKPGQTLTPERDGSIRVSGNPDRDNYCTQLEPEIVRRAAASRGGTVDPTSRDEARDVTLTRKAKWIPTEKKSPGVSSRFGAWLSRAAIRGAARHPPFGRVGRAETTRDEGDQRAQGQMREGDLAQARSYEVVPGTHRLPRGLAETLCRETFRRRDVSTAPRTGNGRAERACLSPWRTGVRKPPGGRLGPVEFA